jgi:hypothetical protein
MDRSTDAPRQLVLSGLLGERSVVDDLRQRPVGEPHPAMGAKRRVSATSVAPCRRFANPPPWSEAACRVLDADPRRERPKGLSQDP